MLGSHEVCPCPVLAIPSDVLFWRVLQVEQLEDPVAAAAEVVRRCEAPQLMALYKVGLQDHTID